MDALSKHFECKPSPFLWMDVAIVDQYGSSTKLAFSDWAKVFRQGVQRIDKAVLVLTPAKKPICVTRSWCCFEWTLIKTNNIPYEYYVNPKDAEELAKAFKTKCVKV